MIDQGIQQIPLNQTGIIIPAVYYNEVSDPAKFRTEDDLLYWQADDGWVEYQIFVDQPGLYNIMVEYMPLGSQMFNIEIGIEINGEYPFREARRTALDRQWRNSVYPFERDDLIMKDGPSKSRFLPCVP